ncbi:MAG TPA: ribosome maturation factor RimP [bacterium]|nr:ribosome maturation factor RimP [bacterium]
MDENKTGKRMEELVRKACEFYGVELIEIIYRETPPRSFLRIFVDAPGGVSVDECEKVSHKIGFYLEQEPDIMQGSYVLEVSSPGLDRPLRTPKEFLFKQGKDTFVFLNDGTEREGKIKGVDGNGLILETGAGIETIAWSEIREGKLKLPLGNREQKRKR